MTYNGCAHLTDEKLEAESHTKRQSGNSVSMAPVSSALGEWWGWAGGTIGM